MKDYQNFPPYELFISVLKHYPESALLYRAIWAKKEESDKLRLPKEELLSKFLISKTVFRNKILSLVDLGLVEVQETAKFFDVTFVLPAKEKIA